MIDTSLATRSGVGQHNWGHHQSTNESRKDTHAFLYTIYSPLAHFTPLCGYVSIMLPHVAEFHAVPRVLGSSTEVLGTYRLTIPLGTTKLIAQVFDLNPCFLRVKHMKNLRDQWAFPGKSPGHAPFLRAHEDDILTLEEIIKELRLDGVVGNLMCSGRVPCCYG